MIGPHAQGNVDNWPDAVRRLPPGTPYKIVDGVQRCIEAKGVNPNIYTVVRHHVGEQNPAGDKKQKARAFFASFVDDTFRGLAKHVDAVQEWNEYFANSQSTAEKAEWIAWAQACVDVWRDEYRTQSDYAHIDLILAETAIGNDIPHELAKMSHDNRPWCLLGYHPYVPVWRGVIRPDDWTYYSGRWEQMDIRYRRLGYTVRWFFGEFGAVGHNGPGFPNSLAASDGWRHKDVYNGNVTAYINMMRYWMDNTIQTHAWKRGDVTGATIFTSGGGGLWKWFEVKQPEMSIIAQFVADYMANIDRPPPPPPPDPEPGELVNPSFEDGWTDQSMQAQEPNGWGLNIYTEGEVRGRPINGGPECVHKHENQLPPDEQPGGENELILDGVYVYKMFTQATWKAELYQVITDLEPGAEYKAIVPVNVHFDGRPDDYDLEDVLFEIYLTSGEPVRHWTTKENQRQWHYLECFGIASSDGMIALSANPSVKWEHPTAFFIDDIRLEKVTEKPPPPDDDCRGAPREQYKRVVLVAHAAATKQQWLSVAQEAYDKKQTASFSYDDAGIGDLDNRTAILYGIEQARRGEFAHWYATHYEGVVVEFRDYAEPQPLLTSGAIGVDVSHWQGKVNWDQTKAAGAEFCYVKATEGKTFVDGSFEANRKGAQDAGLKVGAYHFLKYHVPGEDQAYHFLRTVGDDIGELPPVLDVEDTDSAVKRDVILAWLRVVEDETGVRPVIYTARWVWNPQNFGGQTPWASEYKLWVADYSNDPPLLPMGWDSYWLHQYTNKGRGPDYGTTSPNVDLNRAV